MAVAVDRLRLPIEKAVAVAVDLAGADRDAVVAFDQDMLDAGLPERAAQVVYNGLEIIFARDIVNAVLPQQAARLPCGQPRAAAVDQTGEQLLGLGAAECERGAVHPYLKPAEGLHPYGMRGGDIAV